MVKQIIIKPHTSEKGKNIFIVAKNANKSEIKKFFKVKKVNIINVKPKKRRLGKIEGWRKGYKKVIINEEIEIEKIK